MTLRLSTSDRTAAAMHIIAGEPALVSTILQDPRVDRDVAERIRILLSAKSELQARVTFADQRHNAIRY